MEAEYGLIEGSLKSAHSNLSSSLLMADTTAGVCLEIYPLTGTSFCNCILYSTFVNPTLYLFFDKTTDHLLSRLCYGNNLLGCKWVKKSYKFKVLLTT